LAQHDTRGSLKCLVLLCERALLLQKSPFFVGLFLKKNPISAGLFCKRALAISGAYKLLPPHRHEALSSVRSLLPNSPNFESLFCKRALFAAGLLCTTRHTRLPRMLGLLLKIAPFLNCSCLQESPRNLGSLQVVAIHTGTRLSQMLGLFCKTGLYLMSLFCRRALAI